MTNRNGKQPTLKTPSAKGAAPAESPEVKKKLEKLALKRNRPDKPEIEDFGPAPVSAGPVDKVVEYMFNPTHEKIREVTVIDRLQGRLFPLMDVSNSLFMNCIEIATYRQSRDLFVEIFKRPEPEALNPLEHLMYRTAQWQKSVNGHNLDKGIDIALAEVETRSGEEEEPVAGRGYEE